MLVHSCQGSLPPLAIQLNGNTIQQVQNYINTSVWESVTLLEPIQWHYWSQHGGTLRANTLTSSAGELLRGLDFSDKWLGSYPGELFAPCTTHFLHFIYADAVWGTCMPAQSRGSGTLNNHAAHIILQTSCTDML